MRGKSPAFSDFIRFQGIKRGKSFGTTRHQLSFRALRLKKLLVSDGILAFFMAEAQCGTAPKPLMKASPMPTVTFLTFSINPWQPAVISLSKTEKVLSLVRNLLVN